jgi:hypothetical protein
VSDEEFEVHKGSADCDGGEQNEIEGPKSRPGSADWDRGMHIQWSSPSMLSSTAKGKR